MREDIDPVRWAGQRGVVALPEHMDTSNAGQIRGESQPVVTAQHVSRMLSFSAPDRLISIYPSLESDTSAGKPAVALAVAARPGASWQQILVGSIVRYGR